MDKKVKYWIDTAEYDLDTSQAMLDTGRYLYVGFLCHQTIEKCLKAVIAKSGQFPPKIHNLMNLAEKADLKENISEEQKDFLSELNPLNIEARYPDYKNKINEILTESYCKELLNRTKGMVEWIKKQL